VVYESLMLSDMKLRWVFLGSESQELSSELLAGIWRGEIGVRNGSMSTAKLYRRLLGGSGLRVMHGAAYSD
jgi:hypothetical protein